MSAGQPTTVSPFSESQHFVGLCRVFYGLFAEHLRNQRNYDLNVSAASKSNISP